MITDKEEVQTFVKDHCNTREDVLMFLKGWIKRFNVSTSKKSELQKTMQEIRWIIEAGEALPDSLDRFMDLRLKGEV